MEYGEGRVEGRAENRSRIQLKGGFSAALWSANAAIERQFKAALVRLRRERLMSGEADFQVLDAKPTLLESRLLGLGIGTI